MAEYDIFLDNSDYSNINNLRFGNVVIAKRFKDINQRDCIESGHRIGPYIVVYNDGTKLYCIKGSSSKNVEKINVSEKFHISKDHYGLFKDTVFDLRFIEELDYKDVLEVKEKLNFTSRKKIQKNLMILKNNGRFSDKNFISYSISYDVGDIVKRNNNLFLIINVNNNNYSLVPIFETLEDLEKFIIVDKTKYYLDFEKIINVEDFIPGAIMASSTKKQLLYTSSYFKEYLGNKNKTEKANIGCLLKFNNCFNYIYGENGDKWLVFEVSEKEYVNSVPVIINGEKFYTNFSNNREVLKNTAFYLNYSIASEEERKKISEQKKSFNRHKKLAKNKKSDISSKFKVGDIVKTKTLSDDYYIITEVMHDGVYSVRYEDLKNGIYRQEFFNISFLIKKGAIPKECYSVIDNEVVFNEEIKKLVFRN